jgi:hypothetical protein
MTTLERKTAEEEGRHHRYVGYQIPWYVHLIWGLFWAFAIWYIIRFLFPAIQQEFITAP